MVDAMATPDLNLLVTLDVLLAEGSVARAARRLRLSPSAMSRALARLREATGDPLLVRAGRGLVPTPRALELRERVEPARAGRRSGSAPGEQARPRPARPHLHAANQRRLRRELRAGAHCSRRQQTRPACGCASCRSPTRTARRCARERRSGNRRRREDHRAGSARAGACSAIASSASCERGTPQPGQDHARALCGRQAHQRVAARPRQGPDRRGLARAGPGARRSPPSSAASRRRWPWPAPPT